jgi:hypothetical protein
LDVSDGALLAARSTHWELIGRYRVDRGNDHDRRLLGR